MRYGLIGFSQGFYARTYTRHLSRFRETEVVACCDLGQSDDYVLECARLTAGEFTRELGCELVHDLESFFKLNLDIVMVASEVWEHARHTELALENGCHVFVGKPLTFKSEEVKSIIKKADQYDRIVVCGNPLRHDSSLQQIAKRIGQGEIGEPTNIRIFIHHAAMLRQAWERDPTKSGGPLGTFGIYLIDTLRWMTGQEIVSLYATGGQFMYPQIHSWDTVQAMGTTSGGALVQLNLVSTMSWDYPPIVMDIVGTKGVIRTGYDRHLYHMNNPEFTAGPILNEPLGQKEIENFLDCCKGRTQPPMSLEDMLAAAQGFETIDRSIRENTLIVLDH